MGACPTFKIKNRDTGETRIVNQSDYYSDFRTGCGRFKSVCMGGPWEIVSENHAGGDEGYQESKENLEMVAAIELKRQRERAAKQ